ncbi:MAG: hypothetical protein COX65_07150 [Elusimicrobia bacterium CG_4_10_14_0_2_um_filter_56_8]|nr:MAG: hypothetical protein AUJ51_12690 [Elusimicrobia bacterium CG1_02_56_21]PJA13420.1 MAG: hypothetical protein COX65_07150 [Elusimicrobia bacterium CG_4_10_14_0_2_um_filter_56_8]
MTIQEYFASVRVNFRAYLADIGSWYGEHPVKAVFVTAVSVASVLFTLYALYFSVKYLLPLFLIAWAPPPGG